MNLILCDIVNCYCRLILLNKYIIEMLYVLVNFITLDTVIMAVHSLKLLGGCSPRFRRAPC